MKSNIFFVGLIVLASLSFVSAQQYNCPAFGMGGYGYSGVGAVFGWIMMILVIVALVLFIVWLVKQLQNNGRGRK
ncbi:hypothetical protein COU57_03885 [Candidatus Pacearchaeota archaeon CG10_big_fil_rev_8_21_14_0_10_32_14]|nr:MAG: hypothetical protein COU57_03885 [Candidatus Pacearchaeota archaeon CG10_big_fil_rev_8_21_14_0_10_32_14]